MEFPENYKVLAKNIYTKDTFSLVPIRHEDRFEIMQWRNEQIYHLRQEKPLTVEKQDEYFENVIVKLFTQDKPNQILFSFLEHGKCIGYGGLVHINWIDRNAEISFIMKTDLEKQRFDEIWSCYLFLIEKLAFEGLNLHKIYVYAFDLRPNLYIVLENNNFFKEAVLKQHCLYDKEFIDVVIHSKLNNL